MDSGANYAQVATFVYDYDALDHTLVATKYEQRDGQALRFTLGRGYDSLGRLTYESHYPADAILRGHPRFTSMFSVYYLLPHTDSLRRACHGRSRGLSVPLPRLSRWC